MQLKTHRRILQFLIAIAALVPVITGGWGMLTGHEMLGPPTTTLGVGNIAFDSHIRYLSGLLFAIGIIFLRFIPTIENRTMEVRLLTIIVFSGGLARLYAALFVTEAPIVVWLAIGMELVVTPALCFYQGYIAKNYPV